MALPHHAGGTVSVWRSYSPGAYYDRAMNGNPLRVALVVMGCTIATAAAILLATEIGIPSEAAVPIIVVGLFALRSATRRKTANGATR
jgi:hypothetical protein